MSDKSLPITWLFEKKVKECPVTRGINGKYYRPTNVHVVLSSTIGLTAPAWKVRSDRMDLFLRKLEDVTTARDKWINHSRIGKSQETKKLNQQFLVKYKRFVNRFEEILSILVDKKKFWRSEPVTLFVNANYFRAKKSAKYFWKFVDGMNKLWLTEPGELRGNNQKHTSLEWESNESKIQLLLKKKVAVKDIVKQVFPNGGSGNPERFRIGIHRIKKQV